MAEEQKKVTKKSVKKKAVSKKKVAKKRVVRRAAVAVDTLIARATERGSFSESNKNAVKRYKASLTAANQANKKAESAKARVEKASAGVTNAKTDKQKELAKSRLDAAKAAVREATAQRRLADKEGKEAVALLVKLDKLHDKAHAAFLKAYERDAKTAAKPKKVVRRVARKKAVKKD